jgi:hypothetical protein
MRDARNEVAPFRILTEEKAYNSVINFSYCRYTDCTAYTRIIRYCTYTEKSTESTIVL